MNFKPPIIKLEIEQMHHSIAHALSQHFAEMDAWVQEEITRQCSDINVKSIIAGEVRRALNKVIYDEVDKYFLREPEGRSIIRNAIRKRLQAEEDLDLPSDKSQDLDK